MYDQHRAGIARFGGMGGRDADTLTNTEDCVYCDCRQCGVIAERPCCSAVDDQNRAAVARWGGLGERHASTLADTHAYGRRAGSLTETECCE